MPRKCAPERALKLAQREREKLFSPRKTAWEIRYMPPIAPPFATFSPQVRRALRVDIPVTVLVTIFASLTGPFTGLVLRRQLGATPFQLSVMASASAAFLLLSLAWSKAMQGREPLPYLVWSGFVARGLYLLTPLIYSAWPFVALLVAVNFLGTISGPANAAVIERVYPRGERGRALGLVRLAGGVPGIFLVLGAGTLLNSVDYRLLFPLAGCIGMLGSLRLRHLPVPAAPDDARRVDGGVREAWRVVRDDAELRRLLIASFLFGCGIWLQMPANPVMMADVLGVTMGQMGTFAAVSAFAGIAGNACWGRLADRKSPLATLKLIYLVGAMTPIVFFTARTPWMLTAGFVTDALMNTGLDLVWTMLLIEIAGPARAGQYVAINATLAGIRGIFGPLLGAAVIERFGVPAVYPLACGLMLAALAVVSRRPAWQPAVASR
jgi:MFS family permease